MTPCTVRSGPGFFSYYHVDGVPLVGEWRATEEEAVLAREKQNLEYMREAEDYENKLAREAEREAWAEFRKIRARA